MIGMPWHMLTINHEMVAGGFMVTITSNAASHLYLRYSSVFPRIHRKTTQSRGLAMGWDARFCFTVYQHIEQDEAGDTYTHTFTWPGWVNCNTRYFYFIGTTGGLDSPSESPIFWMHYLWEAPPYGPPETVKFYPDAHPETTSVDGWATREVPELTWAEIHDGVGTHSGDTVVIEWAYIHSSLTSNLWLSIKRTAILFDTSIIPEGSLYDEATFHIKELFCTNTLGGNPSLAVFQSDPISNNQIVPADYGRFFSTPLSDIRYPAVFNPEDWSVFTLNEAGLALVIPAGITKLGLREATYDAPDTPPPWAYWEAIDIRGRSADNPVELKPYLEVTYLPPL